MGAMDPLDGDRLRSTALNVTLTWTWARISNRDGMVEIKVC